MNTQQKDLSYFKLKLQELLNTSFPEKSNDIAFIDGRSKTAINAYVILLKAGFSTEECEYNANGILFERLYFSQFDTVFKVICNEFDKVIVDDELRPFALKMLAICEPVFAQYILTDDFESEPQYELLYTELTGTIANYMEEYGASCHIHKS